MDSKTMTTRSIFRFTLRCLAPAVLLILAPGPARAQQMELPPEQLKEAEALVKEAQTKMGAWENQIPVIEDATDNIFRQQGWSSPEDTWARQVMREVSAIPPWKPAERQDVFLNSMQSRWNLSHDQRNQLNTSLQRETMMLTFKHIKDVMPVAMEAIRARSNGEPFTPEQVQQWVTKLRPMIDDGLTTVQRVTQQLERTMTEDQRKLLQADLAAFTKRHNDMQKMVQKWQAGQWQPTDWGLQNDPIHAPVMQQYTQREAERNALVERAQVTKQLDDARYASDESEWDKYVKWFCRTYECEPRQVSQAEAILKSSKSEAINIRNARGAEIKKLEHLVASTGNPQAKAAYQTDLDRMLQPINQIFDRMKKRLHEDVLTTQQRNQFGPAPVAQSKTP